MQETHHFSTLLYLQLPTESNLRHLSYCAITLFFLYLLHPNTQFFLFWCVNGSVTKGKKSTVITNGRCHQSSSCEQKKSKMTHHLNVNANTMSFRIMQGRLCADSQNILPIAHSVPELMDLCKEM